MEKAVSQTTRRLGSTCILVGVSGLELLPPHRVKVAPPAARRFAHRSSIRSAVASESTAKGGNEGIFAVERLCIGCGRSEPLPGLHDHSQRLVPALDDQVNLLAGVSEHLPYCLKTEIG